MWVHNASLEVDRASRYPRIIAVCTALTLLMVSVVGLRLYVRAGIVRAVGSDDYVTISAAVRPLSTSVSTQSSRLMIDSFVV